MIKLIGVLIILIGFILKLDTIAVVLIAGLATGIVADLDFNTILSTLGTAFVANRYMTLLLLTLATIGILERNGLRERAGKCISKLEGATPGKVLSLYVTIRLIISALSLRLGGHVQFIRPLVYPMVKGAGEKNGIMTEEIDEEIKGLANSMENFGNFFGQNIFVASSGVLLVVSTFKESLINVEPYDVAVWSIPIGIVVIILAIIRNYLFDLKIKNNKKL